MHILLPVHHPMHTVINESQKKERHVFKRHYCTGPWPNVMIAILSESSVLLASCALPVKVVVSLYRISLRVSTIIDATTEIRPRSITTAVLAATAAIDWLLICY